MKNILFYVCLVACSHQLFAADSANQTTVYFDLKGGFEVQLEAHYNDGLEKVYSKKLPINHVRNSSWSVDPDYSRLESLEVVVSGSFLGRDNYFEYTVPEAEVEKLKKWAEGAKEGKVYPPTFRISLPSGKVSLDNPIGVLGGPVFE